MNRESDLTVETIVDPSEGEVGPTFVTTRNFTSVTYGSD